MLHLPTVKNPFNVINLQIDYLYTACITNLFILFENSKQLARIDNLTGSYRVSPRFAQVLDVVGTLVTHTPYYILMGSVGRCLPLP
jgi:hypothetical protein